MLVTREKVLSQEKGFVTRERVCHKRKSLS
jgi:hypothetical protein